MLCKTSELTGTALAWAVGVAEGYELSLYGVDPSIRARVPGLGVQAPWKPQRYWAQGGPIIEREGIQVRKGNPLHFPNGNEKGDYYEPLWIAGKMHGPTLLVAAMRCYVASKLGEEVEVPDELITK
jgi:hypothetical protein